MEKQPTKEMIEDVEFRGTLAMMNLENYKPGINRYVCKVCSVKTKTAFGINNHLKKFHRKEISIESKRLLDTIQ